MDENLNTDFAKLRTKGNTNPIMNAQAITVTTKAKEVKATTTKTIKPVVEEQEDISPISSLELEETNEAEETKDVKPKLTEREKRFARLDELHAGLYEGESDSEWEDADLLDDEEDEETRGEEREKINELIEEAREIAEQMIKDLANKMEAIRSLEKSVGNLTQSINQLKDEVDELKTDGDKDELKEKKKELAAMRKALRTAKASIKEKDTIADYKKIEAEIEAELRRFETMANYFDSVDTLIEYATSNEAQFRSFFGALKCKADLDRSLFFNDTYDVAYVARDDTTSLVEEEYEEYREKNKMSDLVASVSQLEWDETYESLGDEHYTSFEAMEKLNMKQLKFLCTEFNIPHDGKKTDIMERLKSPYELYVPKNKRTEPFDTFKTGDPNQEKYDQLMEEKSFYKNLDVMKILRQRKIMGCQLMRATKGHIKYIFNELGLEIPKGKKEDLVKMLIEHYYELY